MVTEEPRSSLIESNHSGENKVLPKPESPQKEINVRLKISFCDCDEKRHTKKREEKSFFKSLKSFFRAMMKSDQ